MFRYLLLLMLLIASLFSRAQAPQVATLSLYSEALQENRDFYVYTPYEYEEYTHKYYQVLYVFDADRREFFDLAQALPYFVDEDDIDSRYIVVGVQGSKHPEASRNDDLLPKPQFDNNPFLYGKANRANFMKYVQGELMPFIQANYRVTSNSLAVGHSLTGSYVIAHFLQHPDAFEGVIAISPNWAYDKQRLAKAFMSFDFNSLSEDKFLYLSTAGEGNVWKSWKPAQEKIAQFLSETNFDKLVYNLRNFEGNAHWTSYPMSLLEGLKAYHQFQKKRTQTHEVSITVTVDNENDEVFISGNQEVLGDWEDNKVQLQRISAYKRSIKLALHPTAMIRFTGGQNRTEAIIKDFDLLAYFSIPISPEVKSQYEFEIVGWR